MSRFDVPNKYTHHAPYTGNPLESSFVDPHLPNGIDANDLGLKGFESINIRGFRHVEHTEFGPDWSLTLYRGVHEGHPDMSNALLGRSKPWGEHYDPVSHNSGTNSSGFTSWSQSREEVVNYMINDGHSSGVILVEKVPRQKLIWSPDYMDEQEILRAGQTSNATVYPWNK